MSNKGLFFVIFGAIVEGGWAYGLKYADSNLEYLITIILICCSFSHLWQHLNIFQLVWLTLFL